MASRLSPTLPHRNFRNIFALAIEFANGKNVRDWLGPYGTRVRSINSFVSGTCLRDTMYPTQVHVKQTIFRV